MHRIADRIAAAVLPLTLVATGAAAAPSDAVAGRSDLLLAALVLLTALGIEPRRLEALRRRPGTVRALSVGSLVVLAPLASLLSRAFRGAHDLTSAFCLGMRDVGVAAALAEHRLRRARRGGRRGLRA